MHDSEQHRPATLPAFDPAAWLTDFNGAGGYVHRLADGRLAVGWHLAGFSAAQNRAARAAWETIAADADRIAAVSTTLASLIAAPAAA